MLVLALGFQGGVSTLGMCSSGMFRVVVVKFSLASFVDRGWHRTVALPALTLKPGKSLLPQTERSSSAQSKVGTGMPNTFADQDAFSWIGDEASKTLAEGDARQSLRPARALSCKGPESISMLSKEGPAMKEHKVGK